MRTFEQKRDGGGSTKRDAPPRRPSPLERLQHAAGNRAMQRLFSSHDEGAARAAEEHARRETPAGSLLSGNALSEPGRRYFEPIAGAGAAHARIHVGGDSDRLAQLTGAESLSYGNDVFIPGGRSPDSAEGRGLLAHELLHIARAPLGAPRIARKPKETEAHYPTPGEQKEVQKILGRDFAGPGTTAEAEPAAAGEAPKPVVKRGRALNDAEREALATSLEKPLFDTIDSMDPAEQPGAAPPLSEKSAFQEIESARKDVLSTFAGYITHTVTMTRDEKSTAADREARNEVLVRYGISPRTARAFANTVVDTYCTECREKMSDLDDESKDAVKTALVDAAMTKHTAMLNTVARKRVGGLHGGTEIFVRPDIRSQVYSNAAHEFIHHLTHPAFTAAFNDERNIIEGFTEFMTRQVAPTSTGYGDEYAKISSVESAMSNPFGESVAGSASESMRLAYFKGRLDLIGWKPSGPDEEKAVQEAGGSSAWDPKTGAAKEKEYKQRALAKQDPKSNILGFGFYLTRQSPTIPTLTIDYARVLKSSELARGQLVLQGQLLGTPEEKPQLGASLGLAAEYQKPWYYLQSGVRVIGKADLATQEGRIDIAPFAGAGVRLWQRVRVGAEGIVLFPVMGSGIDVGGGASVTIELGSRK